MLPHLVLLTSRCQRHYYFHYFTDEGLRHREAEVTSEEASRTALTACHLSPQLGQVAIHFLLCYSEDPIT